MQEIGSCKVVTVMEGDLPTGHDFMLVLRPRRSALLFAGPSDRAQLLGRAAVLEWSRLRDGESERVHV